jgi:transposase
MDILHPRCAGLEVHKDSVAAAVRLAAAGAVKTDVRTFDTTTPALLALSDWLAEHGCTHVAMETTGSIGSRPSISCQTAISRASPDC